MSEGRQSAANKIWVGVLLLVLAILFCETRGVPKHPFNLIVNGESDASGAQVFVDGKLIGSLAGSDDKTNQTGLSGTVLLSRVSVGRHLLEVKKAKYKTFSKELDMQLEEYVGVDLVESKE